MKSLIFFLIVTLIAMASCVNRSNRQCDVMRIAIQLKWLI